MYRAPSIESLKKAMQTYARQGGTSTIFINDDGLRVISREERDARIAYYANHGIGWVARPKHDNAADGFHRAGRFKKASNMNYGLALSLKLEKHLAELQAVEKTRPSSRDISTNHSSHRDEARYGLQYQDHDGEDQGVVEVQRADQEGGEKPSEYEDLEERALVMAIEEVYEASGRKWRPWAANGRACRVGEIVLIVDSDTVVPEDCLRDAAREMAECPNLAILQHESGECVSCSGSKVIGAHGEVIADVMQVAHHYFENGIAYFTRRVNRSISFSTYSWLYSCFSR